MSNIENCKTVDELRKYSMQELSSLYSKIVKAPAPKFSDKGAAAKRILPLLSKTIKVRGRPSGQLASRIYHFNFGKFYDLRTRFAPQACQIMRGLAAKNVETVTEAELIALIEVKTKQDPWRIFQYYRPRLIGCGVLRVENAS